MIGRVALRRATSLNPALRKADASPVHAKAAGMSPCAGSIGYPSTMRPPLRPARSTAARRSGTVTPPRRCSLRTNRQVTDQTGVSSTGFKIRELARTG